jgi:hypothetical protein
MSCLASPPVAFALPALGLFPAAETAWAQEDPSSLSSATAPLAGAFSFPQRRAGLLVPHRPLVAMRDTAAELVPDAELFQGRQGAQGQAY